MTPSPEEVREALARVVSSSDFASSGRLGPFLEHLVTLGLAGETSRLKESVLGVEFFERGTEYDPRLDPVVRIEARRLRLRLEKYYGSEGAGERVRISLPKGGYVPAFEYPETPKRPWVRLAWAAGAVMVLVVAMVFVYRQMEREKAAVAGKTPAEVSWARGTYQMNLFSEQGMGRAIGYFNEALKTDPKHAPSLASLSQAYAILTYYNALPKGVPVNQARMLAERAIEADPNLAEAHAALGFCLAAQNWQWADGEEQFKKALELNPKSGLTHGLYALSVLVPERRFEEAEREFKSALMLEPNSSFINFVYAFTLLASGRTEEAIGQYQRTLELENIHPDMYWDYGMALGYAGRREEARRAFRRNRAMQGAPEEPLGGLEAYFAGDEERCRRDLPWIEKSVMEGREDRMDLVRAAAMLGELDLAFHWLERAVDARESQVIWLKADPRLKSMWGDARFKPLAARLGL